MTPESRRSAKVGGRGTAWRGPGFGGSAPIVDMKMADIDAMLTINVRSAIVAIRESLPHMSDGGRIINIGSINADRTPFPGQSIYAMTKGCGPKGCLSCIGADSADARPGCLLGDFGCGCFGGWGDGASARMGGLVHPACRVARVRLSWMVRVSGWSGPRVSSASVSACSNVAMASRTRPAAR